MTNGSRQFGRFPSRHGSGVLWLTWLALSVVPIATTLGAQLRLSAADDRRPRFLLDAGNARVPVDVTRSPSLERQVTLDLTDARLGDALAEISRQSGLAIVYSDDVLPGDARVDVTARDRSVIAVLSDVLIDKGLDVVMRPDGSAALVRRPRARTAVEGSIAGKITETRGAAPIAAVTVFVEGTNLGTTTRDDGTYRIAAVPAGVRTIVARRVGYTPVRRSVTITDGQLATVDFQLDAVAASLDAVVTTATGQQRRIELGNTVATVDVASRVESSPVKSIGELLNAQATGVQVQIGNSTGVTSRIRIRGLSSMALSNDPIYVIDGVRMTNTVGGTGTGGGSLPSRVNDLNPEEVENIEVVKGPSAATLYGTDAANGVIVITTKRGRAGAAVWSVHGEAGVLDDNNDYLAQYSLLGKNPGATTQRRCFTNELAAGTCVLDSATTLNLWKDPFLTPLKPGHRTAIGGSVSGGSTQLQYYLSADGKREEGPFGLPAFDEKRFDSLGVRVTDEMRRPSQLEQYSFRANVNAAVNPKLDLSVSTGLTLGETRFPQMDNNTDGFVYHAVAGPGYFQGPGYSGTGVLGEKLYGYAGMTPGEIFQKRSQQSVNRFIGSTTANWRPLDWLNANADVGIDLSDRRDEVLQRLGEGPTAGTALQGSSSDSRSRINNFTSNLRGTAGWGISPTLQLRSTLGAQFVAFNLNTTTATGTQLAPGGEAPSQGAVYTVGANSAPSRTFGAYLEEQLAFRDRLFLTGAIRTDRNSAFGVNYGSAYYPKASLSWIASEEGFFPEIGILTQLRLRASIGSSGVQPGPTSALRTYSVNTVYFQGAAVAGLTQNNPGNADLKPERSTEFEAGFDSRWWNDRITAELTYYRKQTDDALITQPVAPSAGVNSFLANLGGVRNAGWEYRLSAQVVDTRQFGWELSFSGSKNDNEVTAFGNIVTTPTAQIQVGKPLYAVFQRKITYNDANNDGLLSNAEVTISPPTEVVYYGPRTAPVQMALSTSLDLLERRLRLTALVDRKSGGRDMNLELMLPCLVGTSCPDLQRLNSSLSEQSRGVALKQGVFAGYSEDSDFTRLREISATYDFTALNPRKWIGAKTARLSVAARNIALWSDWTGSDPEGFIATNADSPAASQSVLTVSPPLYWMFRVNLTY